MTARRALLAGATGLVGRHCLARLAAAPEYARVVAPVRRSIAPPSATVQVVETDFRDLSSLGPALVVDDVYCCLGTTIRKAGSRDAFRYVDLELPLALARATHARGARQFLLVSSVGADAGSRSFYLRVKGEVEARLAEIGFQTLLVFRPSLLLGDRDESRPGERIAQTLMRLLGPLLRGPLRRYAAVPADAVAAALVAAAVGGYRGLQVFQSEQIVEIGRSAGRP